MRLIPHRKPLIAAIIILLALLAALFAGVVAADPRPKQHCHTDGCESRVKARAYAKNHGGCYSPRCTTRVRAKHQARMIRRLTPYRCATGRYAIPCSIIRCESTDGSWDTLNSIGAKGPYQFLGKDDLIPWPVRTRADRLRHHRLAAKLWAGGRGAGHWAQCLP